MLDIIFQNREKSYGAYFLRKQYPKHLFIALAIVSWLFMMAIFVPNWLGNTVEAVKTAVNKGEIIFASLPQPPSIDKQEIIIPPTPPERPKIQLTANPIPEPTPPEELPDEKPIINDNKTLETASTLGTTQQDGEDFWELDDFVIGEDAGPPDVIRTEVDEDPGIGDFDPSVTQPAPINLADIQRAIDYPEAARLGSTDGRVVVRVLVDSQGNYKRHKIIKSTHPLLSQAVEAELAKLSFTPALQGKKAVSCWVNIPFVFKLMD